MHETVKPRTILELVRLATQFLAQKGIASARLDAEVLLAHVLGKDRVYLYVNFDQPLESREIDAYRTLIVRRGRREPVAYLTGGKEFFSHTFTVNPHVLIPRPETEILVETVIEWAKGRGAVVLADVGTGSGAIAVSLAAALSEATVWATDISEEALRVAERNAQAAGVSGRIRFVQGSWLDPLRGQAVDAVVSNPPYIPTDEIERLAPEIRLYEPRLALDGGRDGLDAYRVLVVEAAAVVRPGGWLAVEVGAGQAARVAAMGERAGWAVDRIVPDHAGIERVVCLRRRA